MGYSHYWNHNEISKTKWESFRPLVEKIFNIYEADLSQEHGLPNMTEDEIILEGIGDDAYETFHFSRGSVKFAFCKTGNRPYDTPVVLILMLFSKLTHFSSDGEVDELPLDEYTELVGYQPIFRETKAGIRERQNS